MKKLLIGLSALLVLLVSGCTPSEPKPKVISHEVTHTKLPKGAAKYKKACDLNDGKACFELSRFYHKNIGVKQDALDALQEKKYLKKACDLNDGLGCFTLGATYLKNPRSEQEFLKGKEYYKKACDLKYSLGCYFYKNTFMR